MWTLSPCRWTGIRPVISHLILTQLPEVPEVQPSNQGLIQAWLLQGPFLEPIELARAGLDPLLRLHPSISSCSFVLLLLHFSSCSFVPSCPSPPSILHFVSS